jgi:apolipoprotein N-acyltransferase
MFRFSIRDVLWLTVVVGLCVAWRVDYSNQRKENHALRAELEQTKIREALKLLQSQFEKATAASREVPEQVGEAKAAQTVVPTP